ncbi:TonB-dependent receptor [Caulobacter rhizosphaerae]|jgi:iron complex outermembrane receptor protein|uniref:TonB-dependent receptor n=2 Tax=Caulobacter rhizosphaerae TaxID=2010972 RepID=UPI0013CF5FF1|nr:TonB-dependent receptor [Caulobacter rhizosphaerae]GGL22611.1 TonB-dependent receptor [Caulobacter rhizosphaerae]
MMTKKLACLASTALVGCLLSATAAMAQSTGSQANEVDSVVVTATGQRAVAGQIVETLPKSRASVDAAFLATQSTGQNVFQSLNLLPGVSFTNNDPYGSSGGNLRLRGFDGARVSVTFDGVPLNDTGNYAVYPNQQLDAELIDRASVNLGTTDVDSPTASATGGTINYITRKPSHEFGGIADASIGDDNYRRGFLMLDTGDIGPLGTRAFVAGSWQKYDKWKGPGSLEKKQVNARIMQDIGDRGDFVSLAVNYNENRNNNIRQLSLADFRNFGKNYDYDAVCNPAAVGGVVVPGNCTNYYGRQVNPSNTGSVRGSALFHLADNIRLTVDPSFQYTLADGGSQLATISETDGRVRGTTTNGKDLNGDGDTADTVAFFAPSVTNTRRYTVTSSLIWDLNEDHRIRVAYTGDYGRHRQTGEYTTLDAAGNPTNVFGGKEGHGAKVLTSDGSFLRARDRFSIAQLNQAAAEYRGKFMDSRLTVNLGVRAPFFKRELNQYCYTQNATGLTSVISGFSVLCTTQTPVVTNTDGTVQFAPNGTTTGAALANLRYIKPWSATVKYDKVLPNAGATYDIGGGHTVYVSYAEGFSSPRTDNLYTATLENGVGSPADTRPESTKTYDLGYRFSSPTVMATAAVWKTDYANRIVQAYDPDLNISIDRNVGAVKAYGLDTQAAWAVAEYLTVTGSFSYNKSEIQQDLQVNAAGATIPLSGKQVVETPKYTFGGRVDWDVTEALHLGVQGKYTGNRFSTDVNDEVAPHYTVWDLSLEYDLPFAKKTYAQLNVNNLFNETYFGSISSRTNAVALTGSAASAPTYYIGSPRTVQFTLRTEF